MEPSGDNLRTNTMTLDVFMGKDKEEATKRCKRHYADYIVILTVMQIPEYQRGKQILNQKKGITWR